MMEKNDQQKVPKIKDRSFAFSKGDENLRNDLNQNLGKENLQDPLVKLIGNFGKWQLVIFLSIIMVKFSSGWVQLMIIFLTPKLTFWCEEFNGVESRVGDNMTCYTECSRYAYDPSPFENTIISEWDLVCERQWLASLAQTILQFGILLGSIVFGFLSDRYGRRHTFLCSVVCLVIFGLVTPFSPNYIFFILLRFLVGFATAGTMVISFVIVIETVGSKYREVAGCLYQLPFIVGHMSLPLFAYYLRSWDKYTLGLAIPPVLYLGYYFVIEESPRWLISVGRVEEAVQVVTKAARINKMPTENISEVLTQLSNDIRTKKSEEPKYSYLDLLSSSLRSRTICCFLIWFIAGFGFFGVNQYIGETSRNPFISVAAAGAIQIPGNIVATLLIRKLGRKLSVMLFSILGGICMLTLSCTPDNFWIFFSLGTFGVSCLAIICTFIYVYTSELFPTVVRNMGFGLSSTAMRAGSMVAPFVANLSHVAPWLPTVIFGVALILAAAICILLPETKGRKLPDTITDIETL